MESKTLYTRLGGEDGLTRIVNDFLDQFFKHERIQNSFVIRRHEAAFHPELTRHWVAFVSQSTGGPKKYEGRTMRSSHAGLRISDRDFDTTIDLMADSLRRAGVAPGDQQELLKIMRAQRANIVEQTAAVT